MRGAVMANERGQVDGELELVGLGSVCSSYGGHEWVAAIERLPGQEKSSREHDLRRDGMTVDRLPRLKSAMCIRWPWRTWVKC